LRIVGELFDADGLLGFEEGDDLLACSREETRKTKEEK